MPRSPSMTRFLWTKSLITISISSINWFNFISLLPFSMYFSRQRFMFPRFCPIASGIPLPNNPEVISIVLCISRLIGRRINVGFHVGLDGLRDDNFVYFYRADRKCLCEYVICVCHIPFVFARQCFVLQPIKLLVCVSKDSKKCLATWEKLRK